MFRVQGGALSLSVFLATSLVPLTAQYSPQQQRRVTQRGNATASTGAYNDPAATMHGVVKKLNGKQLVISTDDDQLVTITRTHKTKFLRKGKEIKASEVTVGSIVSVDVGLFPDLSPQAVNVMVELPPLGSPEMLNEAAKQSPSKEAPSQESPDAKSSDSKPAEESPQPAPAKPAESPNR